MVLDNSLFSPVLSFFFPVVGLLELWSDSFQLFFIDSFLSALHMMKFFSY